jgi:hypothetical protein
VKEFRSSGVQEFRSSGVQEFRSSGVQEFSVGEPTKLQEKMGETGETGVGLYNTHLLAVMIQGPMAGLASWI